MAFCHGSGNLDSDGCCWVDGKICPLRLKIVNGRVLEGPDLIDRGTTTEYINSLTNNGAARRRAADQIQGLTYGCLAAVNAIVANSALLNDRPGFEAAWVARPEYQPIGDSWQARGKPREWCATYGPPERQCCYSETEEVNTSKRSSLTSAAVTIRQGRSL